MNTRMEGEMLVDRIRAILPPPLKKPTTTAAGLWRVLCYAVLFCVIF
jgi:hypothetical protein